MRLTTTAALQTMVNAKPALEVNSGSTGFGAMHNPLRRGTSGKNKIPPRSGDLKMKGGLSYTGGRWGAGFQKSADRLSGSICKG